MSILEIRNYLLQPGMREHFIDNFEAHFIFTQREVNMHVLGQFRVIDQPDRFVWLRSYDTMLSRLDSLISFYDGPVWKKYRAFTNSMLIDSDNVHLLCGDTTNLTKGHNADSIAADLAAATISPLTGIITIDFYRNINADKLVKDYQNAAIEVRGTFGAEMSENTFPRHPAFQIEGEVVVISAYESQEECHHKREKLSSMPVEELLLTPTLRSPLRYN